MYYICDDDHSDFLYCPVCKGDKEICLGHHDCIKEEFGICRCDYEDGDFPEEVEKAIGIIQAERQKIERQGGLIRIDDD